MTETYFYLDGGVFHFCITILYFIVAITEIFMIGLFWTNKKILSE